MRPIVVTTSGVSESSPAVMDHYISPFNIGMGVVITGDVTCTVQHTFDDVFDSAITPTWFSHPTLAGITADTDGNYAFPVRAIRLNQSAGDGSAALTIIQAGIA